MWEHFGHIHPCFDQVQRLMLVDVNFRSCSNIKVCQCEFFWSYSNTFLVLLIRSSELVSLIIIWFKINKKFSKFLLFLGWLRKMGLWLHAYCSILLCDSVLPCSALYYLERGITSPSLSPSSVGARHRLQW